MSTLTVTNAAELQSALASAQGGDVISLAAGNYGNVTINKNFASDVTITSQSSSSPAVLQSLTVNSSSHLVFDGLSVNFTPSASTVTWTPAVSINNSSSITFAHSTVTGGNAITGVDPSATSTDSTGNVIGLATGYGVLISKSTGVTLSGDDISHFYKGVVIASSDYVTVQGSDLHDTRTTPIVAGGGNHITIDSNHIHDVNPWHWGSGDHADFLALWTNAGQASASTDIKVTNNLMEQGSGTAVLGMWLQGGDIGYTNVVISGNTFLNGNFQGITIWDVTGASIDHNTLLQTSGSDYKSAPGILLSGGSESISVHDNITGSVNDQSGSTGALANTLSNNTLVTKWTATAAGYYSSALVGVVDAMADHSSIFSYVLSQLSSKISGDAVSSAAEAITGTAGDDVLASAGTAPTTSIYGGAGADTISGGSTYSYLRGEDGNDLIIAKAGFNDMNGNAGNDTIYGGPGSDWLAGGKDDDLLIAGSGPNQVLYGNMGNDSLVGGPGGDTLRGGQGNDTIIGGSGNDWIAGDKGDDVIYGGRGADSFHVFAGTGTDWIADFNSAEGDRVVLDAGLTYTVSYDGANMIISLNTGDRVVLAGVNPATVGTWLAT